MRQMTCLACGSDVVSVLDLGSQPLANCLLRSSDEPYERYPLGLSACSNCGHAQLSHLIPPESLFVDYVYASGTSNTLRNYFDWFAVELRRFLPEGARVLELACNDGSLLRAMSAKGLDVIGVDPAENLTAEARKKGSNVLTGFFPETKPEGKFDAIVAMNVAAHTPRPLEFLTGIAESLADEGIAIIQTSQAKMIENGELDTIYHEHCSFFSPSSMAVLARRAGLVLESVRLVAVHGTSYSFQLREPGAKVQHDFCSSEPFAVQWPNPTPVSMDADFSGEKASAEFGRFADKARSVIDRAHAAIECRRAEGYQVALVGVAAKAMTFIGAANIRPDHFLDEANLKIGLFVPGYTVPIRPFADASALRNKTVFLIGAWNFAEEIKGKLRRANLAGEHVIMSYFPEITEEKY
ncbi:MAG: methyltransferase domain-containing protein [Planctomycetaceae bacterium]|nr:methyltransferase domain-containing protein [Planctomycetaceae bacterium]